MKDLHIHTIYSDGEYNEYEILEKITQAGITEFAICDHDTIEGSKKVYNILKNSTTNLIFHTGIELSCRVNSFLNGINVHLLVRDFDYNDENLKFLIDKVANFRLLKIKIMIERVKERFNIIISQKDIDETLKSTNSFGKPHLYSILKKYKNIDRDEYYENMKHLPTKNLKLDAIEVLKALKNTKANVTLAHPIEIMEDYNLSYNDIDKLVGYLKQSGLNALETKHSKHTKKDYEQFSKIAKKYNLKETEGSDYHGPNVKPTVQLGISEKTIEITKK